MIQIFRQVPEKPVVMSQNRLVQLEPYHPPTTRDYRPELARLGSPAVEYTSVVLKTGALFDGFTQQVEKGMTEGNVESGPRRVVPAPGSTMPGGALVVPSISANAPTHKQLGSAWTSLSAKDSPKDNQSGVQTGPFVSLPSSAKNPQGNSLTESLSKLTVLTIGDQEEQRDGQTRLIAENSETSPARAKPGENLRGPPFFAKRNVSSQELQMTQMIEEEGTQVVNGDSLQPSAHTMDIDSESPENVTTYVPVEVQKTSQKGKKREITQDSAHEASERLSKRVRANSTTVDFSEPQSQADNESASLSKPPAPVAQRSRRSLGLSSNSYK